MSNPLPTLLAAMLALSYPMGWEPLFLLDSGSFAWSCPLLCLLATALFGMLCRARHLDRLARRLILGLYALELWVLHWPYFVSRVLGLESSPILELPILLLPYFVLTGLHGLSVARRMAGGDPSAARGLMAARTRAFAAFTLLPIVAFLALFQGLELIPGMERTLYVNPMLSLPLFVGMMVLFLLFMPFLLALTMKTRPLPIGPLRTRLEELCRRSRIGVRSLRVIPTGSVAVANAFVTGLFGQARYVFLTETLFDRLTDAEIESILAHELAHVRCRHIPTYFLSSIAWMLLLTFAGTLWDLPQPWTSLAGMLLWFQVFTFVSRRFEREADLVGVTLVDTPTPSETFANALSQVGWINGAHPNTRSPRHFSISERIETLTEAMHHSLVFEMVRSECRRLRVAAILLALLALPATLHVHGTFQKTAPQREHLWIAYTGLDEAIRLRDAGDLPAAAAQFRQALSVMGAESDAGPYIALGEVLEAQGAHTEAAEVWKEARRHPAADPDHRRLLMRRKTGP